MGVWEFRGLLWKLTDRNDGETGYVYYDDGSLHTMTYPNGVVATYTYDQYRGWLTHLIHESGETTIAEFTYEYDPADWGKNGTRTAMVEYVRKPDGNYINARVDYTYDDAYQLTGEDRTGSYAYLKEYTYDGNGNRLTMDDGTMTYYHYDMASKLLDYGVSDTRGSPSNTLLTYDGAGNTETITPPGADPTVTTYTWDWNSKLNQIEVGEDTIAQFAYDGDGLRSQASIGSVNTNFVRGGFDVLAETDTSGNLVAFYTHGAHSRSAASGTIYYHCDGLGSTKATTSQSALPVGDAYSYDAWGNILAHVGNAEQPYQYAGALGYYTHYQEPAAKLLQLGLRYYQPAAGRFISRDPTGDGSNLYVYVRDNPINSADPSGLRTNPLVDKALKCAKKCAAECAVDPFPDPRGPGAEGGFNTCFDRCFTKCMGVGFGEVSCVELWCVMNPRSSMCCRNQKDPNPCNNDQTNYDFCHSCCEIKQRCCMMFRLPTGWHPCYETYRGCIEVCDAKCSP